MKNNNKKKINNGMKFFLIVLFLYFVLLFLNFEKGTQIMIDFIEMNKKILPLLGFVFVAMVLVNSFLTEDVLKKHLGEGRGIKGFFYATIAGILVSGPPYVLFPMLAELKKKGLSNYHLAIFLFNRNVKIPFFPALIFYFGFTYSLILSFYIIIFSFFNGVLVDRFTNES